MDRKIYQWISQLLRDKPDQTTERMITAIGQRVISHYGCGYVGNNRLIFTAENKRYLRRQVLKEVGLDPFSVEKLPEGRLRMAEYHADEKLASKPAGDDHLLLNGADGIIRVNGEEIALHPHGLSSAGLLCMNSGIRSVEHQTIVVVENLAIMPLCCAWRIPCVDPRALWVYRGDYKSGATAGACREFVRRFGSDKTVIVFSDMDPKGLEIALTLPLASFWLGPSKNEWEHLLNGPYANKAGFDTQSQAMNYLLGLSDSNGLSEPFKQLVFTLQNHRNSLRQEHMFSHNMPLELIPIEREGNA
ncbi:DUF7281 domain-containing protein [Methylomonas sp. MgM2]